MKLIILAILLTACASTNGRQSVSMQPTGDQYQGFGQPPKTVRIQFHDAPSSSVQKPRLPPPNRFPAMVWKPTSLEE